MKKRMISFGYQIVDGEIAVVPNEANIVRQVFQKYCDGSGYHNIAEELSLAGVVYYRDDNVWSKRKIARIIENKKYIGGDDYPQIVDYDLFHRANEIKSSKAKIHEFKECLPIFSYLKSNIVCDRCGGHLNRLAHFGKQERWLCGHKCEFQHFLYDDEIYKEWSGVILKAKEYDFSVERNKDFVPYKKSQDIMRMNNEIIRQINAEHPNFSLTKKLIFHCAEMKFRACKEDKYAIYTQKVKDILKSATEMDTEKLSKIISKITIDENGRMKVLFINGIEITNETGEQNATENCNEDRSKSAIAEA